MMILLIKFIMIFLDKFMFIISFIGYDKDDIIIYVYNDFIG